MASKSADEPNLEEGKAGGSQGESPPPASPATPMVRDIRRYYCEFCGICRSKKSLIASHVLSHHQDEVGDLKAKGEVGAEKSPPRYTCEECGASFRKPAYLRQHMRGHSIERPFACPVDDCHHSYRRKDHLTRHLLQHQGKLFTCPAEGCNRQFSLQANMQRHVKQLHDEESPHEVRGQKEYVCLESGCGKAFKYPSKLRKHEDSHVKLDYVEVICGEPGCMKHFTNSDCLKAHVRSCHQHIQCPTCGTQQLKKNFKRHLCAHEKEGDTQKIKCSFPGCLHIFSNKSNLNKHVKAVHLELQPFTCRISGCGLKFSYKHVRDNHEKCGSHTYLQGDFLEYDQQFRSRPRGGRKRKPIMIESLLRKRIAAAPEEMDMLQNGTHHMSQILGDGQQS